VCPVIFLHSIRTDLYFLSSFESLRQIESQRKENALSATKLHHDTVHVQLKVIHMSVCGECVSPTPLRRAGICKRSFTYSDVLVLTSSSGKLSVPVTQKSQQFAAEGNNSINAWCKIA
jgi:hypothetical protein